MFDNHSETSSDSDETGSYSSADEHSEMSHYEDCILSNLES